MKMLQRSQSRREFLADVGKGMITATIGCGLASELGLASAQAGETRLEFGSLEPLVRLMQETPAEPNAARSAARALDCPLMNSLVPI